MRVSWTRVWQSRERWIVVCFRGRTDGGIGKVTMKFSTTIVKIFEWSWLTLSRNRERFTGDLYVLFPSDARPYVSTFRSRRQISKTETGC